MNKVIRPGDIFPVDTVPGFCEKDGVPAANRFFRAGKYRLLISGTTHVMGILNITPDSFSDGGSWHSVEDAVEKARAMERSGATIIDVGGESTRPGHTPVSADEEERRVLPVIEALSSALHIPISIDTSKSRVAAKAVAAGASIINDVWGARRDPDIASVAAETGAGLILMFNMTDPARIIEDADIVKQAMDFLRESLRIARERGVPQDALMIDPGIGFGMDTQGSLDLIRGIPRLSELGAPILVGPSRKRFIGQILDKPVEERMIGTIAVCCAAACLGAHAVRVHDVDEVSEALRMIDAVRFA